MPPKVVVADQVEMSALASLAEGFLVVPVGPEELVRELRDAVALIVRSATQVDGAVFDAAPALRVIGRAGVGVDNIDVDEASRRGVAVFNAPGGNTIAAAELTVALMLAAVRRVAAADRAVRDGRWDRSSFRGIELAGKTLGLVGAGRIGGEVAARCSAFGMGVVAYDPYLEPGRADGLDLVSWDRLLAESDVVSIHVPLSDETRHLLDAEAIGRLKPGSFVVNVSRGGVIDESALVAALESGHLAGAALDVYETEPLPEHSPLRDVPNLVMTPHLGASTAEAQVRVAIEVADSIRRALIDGEFGAAVNAATLG